MDTVVIMVLLAGGSLAFWYYMWSTQKEAWEQAAKSLGLELANSGLLGTLSITGTLKGRSVSVRQIVKGGSSRRRRSRKRYFTEIEIGLKEGDWRSVKLKAKGLGGKVATFFGGQDIETGDATFDKDFRVQGSISDQFREAVRQGGVKELMGMIRARTEHFEVESGTLMVRHRGRCKNSRELESMVAQGVEWSEGLDQALGGESKRIDEQPGLGESEQLDGVFSAPGAASVESSPGGGGRQQQGDQWGSGGGGGGISAPGASSVESGGNASDGSW